MKKSLKKPINVSQSWPQVEVFKFNRKVNGTIEFDCIVDVDYIKRNDLAILQTLKASTKVDRKVDSMQNLCTFYILKDNLNPFDRRKFALGRVQQERAIMPRSSQKPTFAAKLYVFSHPNKNHRFLGAVLAAAHFGVSKATIYAWKKAGTASINGLIYTVKAHDR